MFVKKVNEWTKSAGTLSDWFTLYKDYYEFDKRIVNIRKVKEGKKDYLIHMETIEGVPLDEIDYRTLNIQQKRFILNEFTDIWLNHLKFKNVNLGDNEMFYHNDYHLGNLLYTGETVRLIDPDSFFKRNILSNRVYIGKFIDSFSIIQQKMLWS